MGWERNVLSTKAYSQAGQFPLRLHFHVLNIGFLFTCPWLDGDAPFDIA